MVKNTNWSELQIRRFTKIMSEKCPDINVNSLCASEYLDEYTYSSVFSKTYDTQYAYTRFWDFFICDIFKPELNNHLIKNENYFMIKKRFPNKTSLNTIDFKYYVFNTLNLKNYLSRSDDFKEQVFNLNNYYNISDNPPNIVNVLAADIFIQYIYECYFDNQVVV